MSDKLLQQLIMLHEISLEKVELPLAHLLSESIYKIQKQDKRIAELEQGLHKISDNYGDHDLVIDIVDELLRGVE